VYRISRAARGEVMGIFRSIIIMVFLVTVLLIPSQGFCQGTDGKEKGAVAPKSPWGDIKTAAKPIVPNIPDKYNDLVEAFNAYWNAIKERDYKKAYGMESAESREKTSFDLYKHLHTQKPVKIVGVRPLEVRPIEEEKEVMVDAGFGFKTGFIDSVNFIKDHWVKEEGAWKHVFKAGDKT
jgi:hypothetical protein